MKIKQTIFAMVLLSSFLGIYISPPVSAGKCAGVETSIIDCEDPNGASSLVCEDGTNPIEGADSGLQSNSEAYRSTFGHYYGMCKDGKSPIKESGVESNGIWSLLLMAINILTGGIAIVAIGGVAYGAVLYSSAGGDAAKVKKAKEIIINVVIGLVAYVLMYSFLNYLIPGGLFS